jgi:hypothetical protein
MFCKRPSIFFLCPYLSSCLSCCGTGEGEPHVCDLQKNESTTRHKQRIASVRRTYMKKCAWWELLRGSGWPFTSCPEGCVWAVHRHLEVTRIRAQPNAGCVDRSNPRLAAPGQWHRFPGCPVGNSENKSCHSKGVAAKLCVLLNFLKQYLLALQDRFLLRKSLVPRLVYLMRTSPVTSDGDIANAEVRSAASSEQRKTSSLRTSQHPRPLIPNCTCRCVLAVVGVSPVSMGSRAVCPVSLPPCSSRRPSIPDLPCPGPLTAPPRRT